MVQISRAARRTAVLATAAALVTLTACSSDDGGSDAAASENLDGRGPITFAMGKNDTDKLQPVIAAWNANNPDEQVTLEELPGEADDQRERLVQSLQAGNADYDVMALDVTWTAEFAANGWLQALEDDLAIDTSGLLPATVDSATYRDTLYAAPQNTNAQLLYYRTDLAPEAPATWSALIDSCAAVAAQDVDCLVTQLKQYEGLTVNTTQAIHSWGGAVVGSDGATPEVDSPEARAGLQALVDAYEAGQIPQRATGFTEEETNFAFVNGEAAYAYNWPYMFGNADEEGSAVAGRFAVAPIVGPDGAGASTLGGYNNGINVFSEAKATARDFVEFVQSAENQAAFADAAFPPVLASVYDDAELIAEYPYLPALKAALESAEPRPVTPYYANVSKAIQDNAFAAITGQKSVDQAITDMSAAISAAAN
ncbi:ABC transporter substrate-binding protein [Rhodococcus triatomae]|uniref:Multiple sugar transport system substrate-binding protein n=1 Tax=Rhodococcus triatomae TaxID=300028 RepID=A0A1G8LK15_9NOCA|nr:ABC transporter substrate-binding protein [Rhodococcus triatomae]QNG20601.1 ABC transporter substrate-binding protein [Rhodococcus triatomae]QNG23481.1 ABC transporter substrate-binding protein [Rhodococcus triatomae]SDI55580.1 multiple sugar transport system substrate-binding protein [Rhodococcus triatomae]